jgi:hypothetical protein
LSILRGNARRWFATELMLKRKINSLTNQQRYHDTILRYFQSLETKLPITIEQRYENVLSCITELWVDSEKNPSVFKDAKDFEPILKRIPYYRDHFLHSFNVFTLGYYIVNRLKEIDPNIDFKSNNYNLSWMLASTFHDVAYPIQEMESWLNDLLEKFLGVNPHFHYNVGEVMPMIYIDFMRMLSRWHKTPTLNSLNDGDLDWTFYNEIASKLVLKNHGVIGALMLAHLLAVKEGFATQHKWDFLYNHVPACHAISLHYLPSIPVEFSKHPLAYILILCDELQDWGRPSYQKTRDLIELKDINIEFANGVPIIQLDIETPPERKKEFEDSISQRLRGNGKIEIKT